MDSYYFSRNSPRRVELNRRESNKSNNFNVQARHSSISRERDVNKKKTSFDRHARYDVNK